jgi:transcriptional regulator with GAF, ATPase, and Fis domain
MAADHASGEEFLAPLLHALAESLDVRDIFARISEAARTIVPHEFLMLGVMNPDQQTVTVHALSGPLPDLPNNVPVDPALQRALFDHDVIVFNDVRMLKGGARCLTRIQMDDAAPVELEIDLQPIFRYLVAAHGYRSFLRVAVRLRGDMLGGMIFCASEPDAFSTTDRTRAKQIANCVALALAHQRLADEKKKSADAQAHAARLEVRVKSLTDELEAQGRHRVLGQSRKWQAVLDHAKKVAPTEATVLLFGESGTGKEVAARFIHRASPRSEGPFVAINCAALPEQLLESELFGHEKGAFTGAMTARAGKIEQASGGLLFLDEVGEMSATLQAKFLRVLQEREFQRVGGDRTIKADIRVLAATNRDLKTAVTEGRFREDLYYRLAVFDISLPPLRERLDDLPLLVDAFLDELGSTIGRPAAGISAKARALLAAYPWPGNVRELRNAIERAVILCDGGEIAVEHLPLGIVSGAATVEKSPAPRASRGTLDATEREMIMDALTRAGHNKSKAARLLGLTRAQLRSRLEKHGISSPD